MAKPPIYLDYCATTPVDARVLAAMMPYFNERFGNAASLSHGRGRQSAEAVEVARRQVAALVNCSPDEVIWTSGATEANNLAIKGVLQAPSATKRHVVVQATEHNAVLDPCRSLTTVAAIEVTVLGVDGNGFVRPSDVAGAIREDTALVSVMWANNEIGTIMPVREIAQVCTERRVIFHTDASQAVGKIETDCGSCDIDLLSISGHKLYGPKGIGALVFRKSAKIPRLAPLIDGGGHERGMRSGTLNVPAIVGFGAACDIASREMGDESRSVSAMRDMFETALTSRLENIRINACEAPRLPNVSNIVFRGVDAESLLIALDRVEASTGSACTSAALEPSHVLRALGIPPEWQRSALRFSFGRQTTEAEVRYAVEEIVRCVSSLRDLNTSLI